MVSAIAVVTLVSAIAVVTLVFVTVALMCVKFAKCSNAVCRQLSPTLVICSVKLIIGPVQGGVVRLGMKEWFPMKDTLFSICSKYGVIWTTMV